MSEEELEFVIAMSKAITGLLELYEDALRVIGRLLAKAERGELPAPDQLRAVREGLIEATLGGSNIRLSVKPMLDLLGHLNQEG